MLLYQKSRVVGVTRVAQKSTPLPRILWPKYTAALGQRYAHRQGAARLRAPISAQVGQTTGDRPDLFAALLVRKGRRVFQRLEVALGGHGLARAGGGVAGHGEGGLL